MTLTALDWLLLTPLIGILLLLPAALKHHWRSAGWLNSIISTCTFGIAIWVAWEVWQRGPQLSAHKFFFLDAFNIYLVVITALVGMSTAFFAQSYMAAEIVHGRVSVKHMRLFQIMYQAFMFSMLLALTTNNLGLLWVAMEAATLATVLLVSLYRTPEAIEAAWKYFILCGVGIAQALFGTVLIYFAAEKVISNHNDALSWTVLHANAGQLEATVMSIAFVFILVGYGTKVGLVPLHNWLPDAHSEGPTPMSVVLSGLLLNVALYALVRIKTLVDGSLNTDLAGHLMMGFGLLSVVVAALFLPRQHDIKRLFSYSSIEHMGLMTFAFGLGHPLATFGALLHMAAHSLTKSALFITVGHVSHLAGTQNMDRIRGLLKTQPTIGWGLLIGTAAIAGFPPFGIFTSEFLLLIATMKTWPWLTLPLVMALIIAFVGLFKHLHPMVYGEAPPNQMPIQANMLPVFIHLLLALWLGLSIPLFLNQWFEQATVIIIGNSVWSSLL